MAYVTPQLLCQDMPLTFQAVNDIQENFGASWLFYVRWHGSVEPGVPMVALPPGVPITIGGTFPGLRHGDHNDPRIPRSTPRLNAGASYGVPTSQGSPPGILGRPQAVSVGVIDVPCALQQFYVHAIAYGTAIRHVQPTILTAASGAQSVIRFESFELDAFNAFVPANFDFCAAVYGTI